MFHDLYMQLWLEALISKLQGTGRNVYVYVIYFDADNFFNEFLIIFQPLWQRYLSQKSRMPTSTPAILSSLMVMAYLI